MKNTFTFFLFLVSLFVFAQKQEDNSMSVEQAHQMMEDLYKTVQYNTKEEQILYSLKVFNGVCNYKIWINDMPVHNMYKGARGELSFTINGKILKAGKQELKIRIYPYWNREEQKFEDYLHKYAGLDVEISEMDWDAETRKWDYYPILTYQTPREGEESLQENPRGFLFEEGKEELPYYEETVNFEAKVPYNLTGWSKSVDLRKENQKELFKEAKVFYQGLIKNFKNKNVPEISKKYYNKEKEVIQALFLNQKDTKERWNEDFLSKIINPSAVVDELNDNLYLEFYGNGKVVSLLKSPAGTRPLVIERVNEQGKKKYLTLDLYLHRPTPEEPLEIIR